MKMTPPQRLNCVLVVIAVAGSIVASRDSWGQRRGRDPHLAYAYPAGCERGMPSEIVVGGQFLQNVNEVYVSGEGVQVKIVRWYRPLSQGEYNNLRMLLEETRERLTTEVASSKNGSDPTEREVAMEAGITDFQLDQMKVYRERDRDPRRQPNDQLEEQITLQVTTDIDVELGKRELRFLTDDAISNPIWIHINKWVEHRESEPNDVVPADVIGRMPFVNNGQIMPGDVDRFRFEAKKGMRLVVAVAAREVIPFLADAVPGWFQAVMRVTDELGEEVGFADSFHYRQDPVLYFEVPRDGRYTVEIRDALYRGREDFVYRVTVGEIPFVTSIYPLGGSVDSDFTVQLHGWNLKNRELPVKTPSRSKYRPVRWYSVMQGSAGTVRFPLQIDYFPELFDEEPNDNISSAQTAAWPTTINGRIDRPGDVDVYRLDAGARMVAEVHARRLGSPLDSMLTLTDADGNEVAFNDDHKDMTQAMQTHHADSLLSASIPASGEYFLHISDAQRNGGEEFSYRLRLASPQADYELRVVPSTIMARAGQVVPITVFALRKDGFAEDIEVSLVDPPEGFRLDGRVVPRGVDRIQMTLTVPATAPAKPVQLEMEGAARRGSRSRTSIVRPAVPAENMMQAFIWYHLVPVEQWSVVVSGRPGAKMPIQIRMPSDRIVLPRGGELLLNILPLVKNIEADQFHVELIEPPEGITASIISDEAGRFAIEVTTSADEVEPGLRGNLLINVYKEYTPEPTEAEPAPKPRRTDYGMMRAIPFEVTKRKSIR
jgi:hypothetical protein